MEGNNKSRDKPSNKNLRMLGTVAQKYSRETLVCVRDSDFNFSSHQDQNFVARSSMSLPPQSAVHLNFQIWNFIYSYSR